MIFRGFRLSCRREVFSRGLQGHPCRKEAPCKETQHRHAALLPPRAREARCVQSEGAVGHEGSLLECATETTQDDGHLAHRLRCVAGHSARAGKAFRPHVGSTSSAAQGLELDGVIADYMSFRAKIPCPPWAAQGGPRRCDFRSSVPSRSLGPACSVPRSAKGSAAMESSGRGASGCMGP